MCYMTYVATTWDGDLGQAGMPPISFVRADPGDLEPAASLLTHPQVWEVRWMGGCSCGLRHVDPSLGFGLPEEWYPEDPENVANTAIVYRVLEGLLRAGHAVECLDVWVDTPAEAVQVVDVRLDEVPVPAFRFLESRLLRLTLTADV